MIFHWTRIFLVLWDWTLFKSSVLAGSSDTTLEGERWGHCITCQVGVEMQIFPSTSVDTQAGAEFLIIAREGIEFWFPTSLWYHSIWEQQKCLMTASYVVSTSSTPVWKGECIFTDGCGRSPGSSGLPWHHGVGVEEWEAQTARWRWKFLSPQKQWNSVIKMPSKNNFQPKILYPVILSIEHETRQVILRHERSQNILPLLHSFQEDMVRCTLSNKEENQERGRH